MKASAASRYFSVLLLTLLFGGLIGLAILLEKPTSQVKGQVLSKEGNPIAKAVITTGYGEQARKAYTDESGNFVFNSLPVGQYSFHVKAKGYNRFYYNQEYQTYEGEALQLPTAFLNELESSLYATLWNRTRTLKEKTFISLSGSKVKEVHFTLYQLDLIAFLKGGGKIELITNGDLKEEELQNPALKKIKEWKEEISENDVPEFEKKFAVPAPEPGVYLVGVEAASTDRKKVFSDYEYFNLTDLGFILKRAPEKWFFYASHFSKMAAAAGAQITLFDAKGVQHSLQIGPDGLASLPLQNVAIRGETLPVVVLNHQNSYAFMRVGSEYEEDWEGAGEAGEDAQGIKGQTKIFTYTERPLYRPGQEVFFKGIVRKENSDGSYSLPENNSVEIEINNHRGDVLYQSTLTTNNYGAFWGQIELDSEADLGYYEIKTEYAGKMQSHYFEVDEYRKPEFKLEIEPGKTRYFSGEKVIFNIDAQYYFGAPVEAEIEYSVYQTEDYASGAAEEWEAAYPYYSEYGGGYGEFIQEGTLKTDANGKATLSLEIPKATHNRRISLRVTAKDASDRSVTQEGEALVAAGDFYFRTRQESFLASPQKPFPLFVRTRNYQGQGVAREYEIKVQRETWNPRNEGYDYHTQKTFEGETDKQGMGKTQLTFEEGGYYRLLIAGEDPQGRKVEYSDYVWVSGEVEDEGFGLQKDLVVIADKKKFEAGEKAKLFIVSPIKDAKVWITVEGLDIYESRLETIEGFSKAIEIELQKAWVPNVEIRVSLIGKKEFYESGTPISISAKEKFLNVELKSKAKEYQPGETIDYEIVTKDAQGKPITAELSLGVVDERIYALKADSTDIKMGFWGPRENRVRTDYSFSGYFSGGIAKEDQAQLRRNFKDTAYWIPSIITDENGRADVSFKLPDNLTTWRATAVAQTQETHVGQQTHQVIATKDLLVRLALPRFFTERDRVVLKALVQNYSETTQEVKTSLNIKGLDFTSAEAGKDRSFKLAPNQTVSFDFEVKASEPGTAMIQFLAKGNQDSDGLELKVPVLPYGIEDHHYHQGEIDPMDRIAYLEVPVPPQAKLASSQWHISLDNSLAGQLLGSLNYLVDYPYGCVEQTTSRILPALLVADLYRTLEVRDPMLEKKIPKVVSMGLKRLKGMQHSDGGWGWWKHDDTHFYMTSYALYGLLRAQDLGVQVDPVMLEEGKKALQELLEQNKAKAQMSSGNSSWEQEKYYFAYYVGSLAKLPALPSISIARLPQNLLARAYLILALKEQGRDVESLDLAMQLSREAVCEAGKCYFSEKTDPQYNYLSLNKAEVTAWGLQALLKADPENRILAESLAKWLLEQRRGGRWRHTRETASAIYGLSEYAKTEVGREAGIKALLRANEKNLLEVNEAQFHWEHSLSPLPLVKGKNSLQIENLGEHKLYYQSDVRFYVQEDALAPSSAGIEVKREYFIVEEIRQKGSSEVTYTLQPVAGKIPLGSQIGVRITLESPEYYDYLIVEDPLPAGFEVIKEASSFDKEALAYTEREIHDEKAVFFATYLGKGTHVFNYVMQPELKGSFNALPTQSYEMYRPEKRGSSASHRLEVQ